MAVAMDEFFFFSLFVPPQAPQLTEKTQGPPSPGLCTYALGCTWVCALFLLANLKPSPCRKSSSFVKVRCLLQGLIQLKSTSYGVGGKKGPFTVLEHSFPLFEA